MMVIVVDGDRCFTVITKVYEGSLMVSTILREGFSPRLRRANTNKVEALKFDAYSNTTMSQRHSSSRLSPVLDVP